MSNRSPSCCRKAAVYVAIPHSLSLVDTIASRSLLAGDTARVPRRRKERARKSRIAIARSRGAKPAGDRRPPDYYFRMSRREHARDGAASRLRRAVGRALFGKGQRLPRRQSDLEYVQRIPD